MGNLVLTGATSGSTTVQPTDAVTAVITLPATSGTLALAAGGGSPTFTSITTTNDASISGRTVGKGGGSIATNTAVGDSALSSNTSGLQNNSFGTSALTSNTTGSYNCGFGRASLLFNTTGSYNTALGGDALFNNTTASNNTAVGYQAGYSATTGANHALLGYQAGYSITTGQNNTLIGYNAGQGITTGTNNLCLGINCGQYSTALTTGSQNIYIGTNSGASSATVQYEMVIGLLNTVGKGSSTGFIQPQGGGMYQGNNSATWSITSDARLKKNIVDNTIGLDAINQIQVRNFEYRTADEVTDLPSTQAIAIKGVQLGAIAQELKEILPDCVKTESTGVMSVDTTNLTWYLINAVKELNAKVTALEAQLGAK